MMRGRCPQEASMPKYFSIRPTWTFKGRRFQGVRGFSGKPFHPPLTDFPIVCYSLAAVFDLISYFSGHDDPKGRDFFVAATFVMVSGFLVSLATALTGFWDWWRGIPRDKSGWLGRARHTQVWRTINWHATVMVTVTVIALIDVILRIANFDEGYTGLFWLVLSALAALLVLFGAGYGGGLVFEYGFNVEMDEKAWEELDNDRFPIDRRRPRP
jgi:uncharacterized membrane protein